MALNLIPFQTVKSFCLNDLEQTHHKLNPARGKAVKIALL